MKYFPIGTIFDAKISSRFYAWKSIIHSHKAISQGAKWRIGDGKKIKVYDDLWLLGNYNGKILSPHSQLPKDAKVESLIDPKVSCWNSNLIDQCFLPFEAQRIKSIPLCSTAQEDFLI